MNITVTPPAPLRVLGLDIEAKRKGSDWGDYPKRNLLCADMRFEDGGPHRFLPFDFSTKRFEEWVAPLREPGILVVAHNAPYDLPGVNGWCLKLGLEPLPPIMVHDTLKDTFKSGAMIHRNLGAQAAQYGVMAKGSIENWQWDLASEGHRYWREKVREYNEADVDVVLALRQAMLKQGHLKPPTLWSP